MGANLPLSPISKCSPQSSSGCWILAAWCYPAAFNTPKENAPSVEIHDPLLPYGDCKMNVAITNYISSQWDCRKILALYFIISRLILSHKSCIQSAWNPKPVLCVQQNLLSWWEHSGIRMNRYFVYLPENLTGSWKAQWCQSLLIAPNLDSKVRPTVWRDHHCLCRVCGALSQSLGSTFHGQIG